MKYSLNLSTHTLTTSWILATHVIVKAISSLAGQTVSLVRRPLELVLSRIVKTKKMTEYKDEIFGFLGRDMSPVLLIRNRN